MKIVTKREADNILTTSLFKPVNGRTLNVMKFDNGKYNWTGQASDYVGRDVPDHKGVHAVYPVRRSDKHGAYCQLMCICE